MSKSRMIPLLLVAATLLAFGNLLSADFTSWDDPFTITSNPHLNPPTWSGLGYHWRTPEYGLYIPLTYTAWWLIAHVAYSSQPDARGMSLSPMIFHAANIGLHLISVLFVYAILRRILKRDWAACIGALLFALHPVQVEAVGWLSGMKDVLCGTLSLAALWAYVKYLSEMNRQDAKTPRFLFYAIGIVFFVLGILSKPSAMVVPGLLLVIDYFWMQRSVRAILKTLWPWFAITVLAAISAKFIQPGVGVADTPLWARPFIVGDSLSFYLYKLVLPINLGIDYGRRPQTVMQSSWFYLAWIVPAIIALALWRWRRSRPLLALAALLFVIAVSPTLGWTRFLFQYFSTTADHYLYVAMLGPALAAGWLMTRARSQSAYVLCGVLLAALGVVSALQTNVWKDDRSLFTQAIAVNPKSFAGYNNLGHMYYVLAQQAPDQSDRETLLRTAAENFHQSIVSNPDYPDSHYNFALTLALHGDVEHAIDEIKESLRLRTTMPRELNHGYEQAYLHLAQLLVPRHRYAEAVESYREFLKYEPENKQAQEELKEALKALDETKPTTQHQRS